MSISTRSASGTLQSSDTPNWIELALNYPLPLILALVIEIMMPILIWRGGVPGAARWLTDMLVVAMLLLACIRMLNFDRIPGGVLLIVAITVVGSIVAVFEGQQTAATIWGWWRMFKYPMVGLYAYLQPQWPSHFAHRIIRFCIGVLVLQVVVQLLQYATGEVPGDHLAGTFGRFGVGPLVMFIFFCLSLALGAFLADGDWKPMLIVIGLGLVSSVLGEMKIFPIGLVVMLAVTMLIYLLRGGRLTQVMVYGVIILISVLIFVPLYNTFVADPRGTAHLEDYLDSSKRSGYLNQIYYNSDGYYFGRGFAAGYGWRTIQRDSTTVLFGMGIGARGESVSLGIVGEGLRQGYYGLFAGTSFLVLLQEVGIVGLASFGIFILVIIGTLLKKVNYIEDVYFRGVCFGVVIFSAFWPLWIWYSEIWDFGATMILYWGVLGYVMGNLSNYMSDTAVTPKPST